MNTGTSLIRWPSTMRLPEFPPAGELGDATRTSRSLAVPAVVAGTIVALPLLRPSFGGNSGPVDLFITLSIVAVLGWAVVRHLPLRAPYLIPFSVLFVAGALGGLMGLYPVAALVALAQDLFLFAWAVAVVNVARTPESMHLLLKAWAWSAIGWAGVLLVGFVTHQSAIAGLTAREGTRAALTFGDPNLAADYFVLSIMIMWASGLPRNRLARIGGYLLLLTALAFTGSNGGWIGLLVGSIIAGTAGLVRRHGPLAVAVMAGIIVLAGGLAVTWIHPSTLEQRTKASGWEQLRNSLGRVGESTAGRALLLRETLGLAGRSSLLGEGPGSTKLALEAEQAPFVKEAHDDYMATLIERGIIGLVGLLLLVVDIGARTWVAAAKPLRRDFAAVVPHPGALLGAVAVVAVSALFYEVLHFRHVWALLALVAALELWGRD